MRSNLTTTRLILIFVVAMVTFRAMLVAQTFQPSKNGSSFADMPEAFPGQIFSHHKPLKIGPVTPNADQVSRYGKLELTVELDATYENPFDPAEVRLDAIFTSPSGQEQIVPGFFLVEHRREVHTGSEVLLPEGHGAWKIRFAPRETGRYSWRLSLRDRSGQITGGSGAFQALPADRPGFVRVSRADPHYFAFDNGQGYFPIGHNLPIYLDKLNLYFHFTALANFTGDLPLGTARWEPLSTTAPQFVDQSRPPETRDVVLLPSNRWGKAEHGEFVIRRDGTIADGRIPRLLLHGGGHPDLKNPPTFVVDYPQPGKFSVHVGKVSNSGLLRVWVDDDLRLEKELPCGEGLEKTSVWVPQWKLWETTYDQDLSVEVSAGRHRIRVDNFGKDWVEVTRYTFSDCQILDRPNVLVCGMRTEGTALLWLQNKDSCWYNHAIPRQARQVDAFSLTAAGLRDGKCSVEWWETWKGTLQQRERSAVKDGRLLLKIPGLETDVAIKIKMIDED